MSTVIPFKNICGKINKTLFFALFYILLIHSSFGSILSDNFQPPFASEILSSKNDFDRSSLNSIWRTAKTKERIIGFTAKNWENTESFLANHNSNFEFISNRSDRSVNDYSVAVPSAPTNLESFPGDRSITLKFTPGFNGGSEITGYEYSIDDNRTWIPTSISNNSFIIGDLHNGIAYTVSIRAINIIGSGEPSTELLVLPYKRIVPLNTTPEVAAGTGTLEDPYLIENLQNFIWIRTLMTNINWREDTRDTHFKQTADIDMTGFTPSTLLLGHFSSYDGGGFRIINPILDDAIFNFIIWATIKNVHIRGAKFLPKQYPNFRAALIGIDDRGFSKIENCSVTGHLTNIDKYDMQTQGSLVASGLTTRISDSFFIGTINGDFDPAGGLSGVVSETVL